MLMSGHARALHQLGDADVRRDGGDRRGRGAGARHPLDERGEVVRQLVELAGADEGLAVIDVGMDDHEVGDHAAGFAGCGDLLVVVDRRADAQAAHDADATAHAGQLRFHTGASSGTWSARRAMAKRCGVSLSNQPRLGRQRVMMPI